MPSTSINCADCGAPYESKRKNVKYCRLCRINRDLHFYAQRTAKCWSCESKFAPYTANQVVCGACMYTPASAPMGHCGLCKSDTHVMHEDVQVCFGCALAPDKRPLFMRAVQAKVNKRLEARG